MSDKDKKNERRSSGKGKDKKTINPQESPRSSAGAHDGRGPGRVSLPVSIHIMVDAGGELHVVDPRRRDSVDVGLSNTVTEPDDWWELHWPGPYPRFWVPRLVSQAHP